MAVIFYNEWSLDKSEWFVFFSAEIGLERKYLVIQFIYLENILIIPTVMLVLL